MTGDQLRACIAFDESLAIGQTVLIHWTMSHRRYSARARVIKLNAKSLRAELLHGTGDYKTGHVILVPRITDFSVWTVNNGVSPDEETS